MHGMCYNGGMAKNVYLRISAFVSNLGGKTLQSSFSDY